MNEARVAELVLGEKTHDRRTATFCALLAKESGLGDDGMTVVGGSAIEVYTGGRYTSDDLDLVVDSRKKVTDVLARWGFKNRGKLWTKEDWGIVVDAMEKEISGSRRHTQVLSTAQGSFRISGPEDLIIRRVRESVNWQGREGAFAHAILLVERMDTELDWDYIEFFAKREHWEAQFRELRHHSR